MNYLICDGCSAWYRSFFHSLHNTVFFIVKASMEYSKSPKTPFERGVGFICNFFREINNYDPTLTFVVFFGLLGLVLVPGGLLASSAVRFLLAAACTAGSAAEPHSSIPGHTPQQHHRKGQKQC